MSTFRVSAFLVVFSILIQGCFSGWHFGYYWNPAQILVKATTALEENNFAEWQGLLSDQAMCQFGDEAGFSALRLALGKYSKRDLSLRDLKQLEIKSSSWASDAPFKVMKTEYFESEVYSLKNNQTILTATFRCHSGESQSYCTIFQIKGDLALPAGRAELCQ